MQALWPGGREKLGGKERKDAMEWTIWQILYIYYQLSEYTAEVNRFLQPTPAWSLSVQDIHLLLLLKIGHITYISNQLWTLINLPFMNDFILVESISSYIHICFIYIFNRFLYWDMSAHLSNSVSHMRGIWFWLNLMTLRKPGGMMNLVRHSLWDSFKANIYFMFLTAFVYYFALMNSSVLILFML